MTPTTIIEQAGAHGILIDLAAADRDALKLSGNQSAVNHWVPIIREHKGAIVNVLLEQIAAGGDLASIKTWLALIGEHDPATISDALNRCQLDDDARGYFSCPAETKQTAMTTIYCGIDPGLGGAIGFVGDGGQFVAVFDMPCLVTTTGRRSVDAFALAAVIRQHSPSFVDVEHVGVRPGEGAVGAFSFGHSAGCIIGVLATLGIAHDLVQPAVWKRKAGIPAGADKRASVAVAKRLLPSAAPYLTRAKDDGRADALLLAVHGWERRRPVSYVG